MKSRVLFLLAFAVSSVNVSGQNLVPNGGFENYNDCPTSFDGLHFGCSNWYKSIMVPGTPWNNNPSPDYFHTCSSNQLISPPNTLVGFQQPYEGQAFAGFVSFSSGDPEYREILGVELNEVLEVGEIYEISFRLVRSNTNNENLATNGVGVKLSTLSTFPSIESCVNNEAAYLISEIITDTLEWIEYTSLIHSDSAYSHLHIGSLLQENQLIVEEIGDGQMDAAYYFVDDVQVSHISPNSVTFLGYTNTVRVFPNPTSDRVNIRVYGDLVNRIDQIDVLDISGKTVMSVKKTQSIETISVSQLIKGLYLFKILFENGDYTIHKVNKI